MAKGQRIGILHPGEMGISIAASAKNSGCEVYWTSEGRSPATRERAAARGATYSFASSCAEGWTVCTSCRPTATGHTTPSDRHYPYRGQTMAEAARSYEFNIENGLTLVGSPETVIRQLQEGQQKMGYNVFCTNHFIGRMPADLVDRSIELFGKEVIPAFARTAPAV